MAPGPADPSLLEREFEQGIIEDALGSALQGEGSAVLVEGDPGVGKTALLRAAMESADSRGFRVLKASGDSLETDLSFGICVQLFQNVVSGSGIETGTGPFSGVAAQARAALEEGTSGLSIPGEDRSLPLINGLYWLCSNLAESAPLLIVVDDIHWADLSSVRFLHFLSRRLDGLEVCLLLAMRPAAPMVDVSDLLGTLIAEDQVVLVAPGALSADAGSQLIESRVGKPDPEFRDACIHLSGGNPLYLNELLRSAGEIKLGPEAGNVEALADLSPERISDSVIARLRHLGESAGKFAEVIAVGGGRLHLRDVATVSGLDPSEVAGIADDLISLSVLSPREPLAFAHPLVQSAVYDAIPAASRSKLQLEVAGFLREAGAGHGVVATHLLLAERRGPEWVVEELEAAATEAMLHGSQVTASRYLRRALEEGPADDVRARLLVQQGLAETESGNVDGVATLAAGVELLPEPLERANALLGLGMILTTHADVAQATDTYKRGIDEVAGLEGPVARSLEMLFEIGRLNDREARETSLPRLDVLARSPEADESSIGRLLLAQAAAESGYRGFPIDSVRELTRRALVEGLDDHDPAAFWTGLLSAYAYNDCDEYDGADAVIEDALGIAVRRGSVVQAAAACHPRAFVNLRRGNVEAALTDATTSVDGAEDGWRLALPSGKAVLAEAHLERGEIEQAAAAVQLPGGDAPWVRLISFAWLLAARGRVLLEQGRPQEALTVLTECERFCQESQLTNPSVIAWRSTAALAAHRLRLQEQALRFATDELDLARDFGAPRAIGVAQRTMGLVSGPKDGIEHLRASVSTLEGSLSRLEYMRSLMHLGSALRRSGSRKEAREPLREALDEARHAGAIAIADTSLSELQAAGGRPRRYELSGPESLTPSERRVCDLAAQGRSNPQIAQALFVTRRTVETHLTNAYRKLDITSREGLAGVL